jgi:SAM-dependent methyltransferase
MQRIQIAAGLTLTWLLATAAPAQVRVLQNPIAAPDPLAGPSIPDVLASPPSLALLQDQATPQGDREFRPEVGQAGKDVIWVPTPDSLVKAMLTVADVKPQDYVVDLGAGDGRIAIAAGRDFGARAHGIEYNPDMVALARRNAQRAGVANRVTFAEGDIFKSDFSDATVVTLYLLPSLNEKLKPTLLKMRPGTRIVSHAFSMGDWEPERTINTDEATGYFWIVPADVAGRWAFEVGNDRFVADFTQRYQKLAMPRGGPLRDGEVKGNRVIFTRANGQVIEGEVRDDQLVGRGWVASRVKGQAGAADARIAG